jgi:site-specific DNA-methyltransferase (adenine-specific)
MLMRIPAGAQKYQRNSSQHGDALVLLQSLSDYCTRLGFFDPQHRDNLDKQKYGNEGARQRERCKLPQMSSEYIDACCREFARVLMPSGYLMQWMNAFQLGSGAHLRLAGALQVVDIIAWDNLRISNGYRARRRGDYLVVLQRGDYLVALQKPPIKARATWQTKPTIPDRWPEKIIKPRSQHPHIKPIGLISALIEAITSPGDLVVDPAAGSFIVMHAARRLGREFIGCDLAYEEPRP